MGRWQNGRTAVTLQLAARHHSTPLEPGSARSMDGNANKIAQS
jgi:hypothetical protein